MGFLDFVLAWIMTFAPFGGHVTQVSCYDDECTRIRIELDREPYAIAWSREELLEEIEDSLKDCDQREQGWKQVQNTESSHTRGMSLPKYL